MNPSDLRPEHLPPVTRPRRVAQTVLGYVGGGLFGGSALFAMAGAAFTPWLFIPAGVLGVASGVVMLVRSGLAAEATGRPLPWAPAGIGMGAEVHASATIEPGAVVEMGATVKSGAVVKSGALIRMGATVGRNAVVESGAVIGWGATIQEGATVQRDASVGAGATLRRDAVLGEGRHVGAGGVVHGAAPGERPARPSVADPAEARIRQIDALCERLEAELRRASPALRDFLSATERSVGTLRSTGRDLAQREQMLRREVAPELLERLKTERAALEARIAAADDAQVRLSLQQATAAIDAQQAQRTLLARNADRLDAELTRLCWSIEGVVAQLVQVHSAGGTSMNPELERGLGRIRDGSASVAEALDAVNAEERVALRGQAPVAAVGEETGGSGGGSRGRVRS